VTRLTVIQEVFRVNPEDGSSKLLRNVGMLSQHYTVTLPWRWKQQGPPKRWCPTATLHGHFTLKMEAARSSESLVSYRNTTRSFHPEDGGSKLLRNVGILSHHYTASRPRGPEATLVIEVFRIYLLKVTFKCQTVDQSYFVPHSSMFIICNHLTLSRCIDKAKVKLPLCLAKYHSIQISCA